MTVGFAPGLQESGHPSPMGLIDTHAHLDSYARQGTLEDVLARARSAGVEAIIAIGTGVEDWNFNRDQSLAHPQAVHYTVGLHPCAVDAGWEAVVAQIEGYWKAGTAPGSVEKGIRPVALGECGLDRFHLPKDAAGAERTFSWQGAAFAAQLAVARRLGCPVVIHSRGAFSECVEMIEASGVDWSRIVFHCFSEGPDEIRELNRRGARGSFTGIVTYKNAENVRAAVRAQGIDRLMVETDAPYLAPVPHRGKTNEPAFVRHTAECAAGLFGIPVEELAERTTRNARAFFPMDG
jgi:TatD DNase family protein